MTLRSRLDRLEKQPAVSGHGTVNWDALSEGDPSWADGLKLPPRTFESSPTARRYAAECERLGVKPDPAVLEDGFDLIELLIELAAKPSPPKLKSTR